MNDRARVRVSQAELARCYGVSVSTVGSYVAELGDAVRQRRPLLFVLSRLRHPERVDRLMLAWTSSGGEGGLSFDLLGVDDLPPDERNRIVLPAMCQRDDMSTDPPTLAPWFDVLIPVFFSGKPP